MADHETDSLAATFEAAELIPDGSAADAMLAKGMPIHIARDDTPAGFVIRVYPNGVEELVPSRLSRARLAAA